MLTIHGTFLTRESGIRVGDSKVVARGVAVTMESISCPCLAWLNQGYVSPVQIPADCYFRKTHNPPHPVGREDAQTDVGSLCHPGTTQATLANGVDTGHAWLHWWHLGSLHIQPSDRKNPPLPSLRSTLDRERGLASPATGGWLLGPPLDSSLWDGDCGAAQLCLWNLSLLEQSVLLG